MELEKGKPTLASGKSEKDVIAVLEQVAAMIRDGKFADAIAEAHTKMRRRKVG